MDDKKERILVIAENMFSRFGIQKTTMDDIAKKARMGKSSLYYYFKSKEDVFAEVIRKDSHIFKQKLNEAIETEDAPEEKLRSYVLTRMKHLKELRSYYTTLTDEYLEHFRFVEEVRKDFVQYENETLKRLLEEGVMAGVFSMDSVEISVRMIVTALKGLEYTLFVKEEGSNSVEDESAMMINILFKGIEVR